MGFEPTDLVTQLTREHRQLQLLASAAGGPAAGDRAGGDSGAGAPASRRRLVERLAIELSRHLVAEDWYLLPVIAETMADGPAAVRLRRRDRELLEQRLGDVERLTHGDGDPAALTALRDALRDHADRDESLTFPLLSAAATGQLLDQRGYLAGADREEFYQLLRGGPDSRFLCPERLAPGRDTVERVWRTMAGPRRLLAEPGSPR